MQTDVTIQPIDGATGSALVYETKDLRNYVITHAIGSYWFLIGEGLDRFAGHRTGYDTRADAIIGAYGVLALRTENEEMRQRYFQALRNAMTDREADQ